MYYISIIVLSQFYIEHPKHVTQWNCPFLSIICYLLKTDYIQNSVLFSLQIRINLLLFLRQVYFHILRFTFIVSYYRFCELIHTYFYWKISYSTLWCFLPQLLSDPCQLLAHPTTSPSFLYLFWKQTGWTTKQIKQKKKKTRNTHTNLRNYNIQTKD